MTERASASLLSLEKRCSDLEGELRAAKAEGERAGELSEEQRKALLQVYRSFVVTDD